MCLLIKHPATTEFNYEDIENFYFRNSDGLGIMYIDQQKGSRRSHVVVKKALPKTATEAYAFYLAHAKGRECAIHFRMKTHGLIDMENCHPYEIPGTGAWLMHNGVLSTGNTKDRTKSDTWHYARDYLSPLMVENPRIIHVPAFQALLGEHIGSGNRFIIADSNGLVVINEHHGVEYKGAWMSNDYAWDVPCKVKYEDADLAVEYFFDRLDDAALWKAYEKIRYFEAEEFYKKVGEERFYDFCDSIGLLTDDAVIECVRGLEFVEDELWMKTEMMKSLID